MKTMTTMRGIILVHVWASGPVSFKSIVAYLKEQFNGPVEDFTVAATMNQLMRDGMVELYDDGESFVGRDEDDDALEEAQNETWDEVSRGE